MHIWGESPWWLARKVLLHLYSRTPSGSAFVRKRELSVFAENNSIICNKGYPYKSLPRPQCQPQSSPDMMCWKNNHFWHDALEFHCRTWPASLSESLWLSEQIVAWVSLFVGFTKSSRIHLRATRKSVSNISRRWLWGWYTWGTQKAVYRPMRKRV
jgi:hypothetical protein